MIDSEDMQTKVGLFNNVNNDNMESEMEDRSNRFIYLRDIRTLIDLLKKKLSLKKLRQAKKI